MLALQLVLVAALATDAKECAECKPGALCKPHAEQETQVLAECRPRFESPLGRRPTSADTQSAIEKLQRIAALDDSHTNAPSARVVETLALGAVDIDPKVRAESVRLLFDCRNRDAVVLAARRLIDAAGEMLKHPAKLPFQAFDRQFRPIGPAPTSEDWNKFYRHVALETITPVVLLLAAKLPDDRIVTALRTLVAAQVAARGTIWVEGPVALVELGTRDSLATALTALAAYERAGRATPTGKAAMPDPAHGSQLHDRFVELAKSKGLAGTPAWGFGASSKWRLWLETNKTSFPERLGTLGPTDAPAGR
jgi:hypothetical protein